MESQINVSDQNTQQVGQNPVSQPVQIPGKPKISYLVFAMSSVLLLAVGFTGGYLVKSKSDVKPNYITQPSPTDYPTATPTVKPTEPPKISPTTSGTYLIKQIHLQYALPPSLSKLGAMSEQIIPGEKGNQLCVTFPQKTSWLVKTVYAGGAHCPLVHFGFGTTSLDFEAGRGGGFTDLQGFEKRDGKYYAKAVFNKTFEIPSDIVEEIVNPNGIAILKVKGKKYDEGPSPFVYDGSIGALINIANNATYRGMAIELDLSEGYTEKEFDQILSSLKFVN